VDAGTDKYGKKPRAKEKKKGGWKSMSEPGAKGLGQAG